MAFVNPQVSDFMAMFYRDFNYGTDMNANVLDQDILNGFAYAIITINPCMWPDQASYTLAFLLLAAHRMVLNLRASSQGINGQYNWAQSQKAAGPISESFQIPERIQNNPELMMLAKTNYGAQFLEMALPYLVGPFMSVMGRSKP